MPGQKVALVTGSSEGGIGAALCAALLPGGCRVFASARRLESMRGLEVLGCELVQLDVCDAGSVKKCVADVVAKAGRIDILVNNAGVGLVGPLMDVPIDSTRKLFETNVYGMLSMSQAVFPIMAEQGGGTIANIGSIAGWFSSPWGATYCASKAAIQSFSDGMRLEMKPFGIDVILIQPGAIKSNIWKKNEANFHFDENGFYKPFKDDIRTKGALSQNPEITPTDVFAEKAVATILKPKPPAHWFLGHFAWQAYIFTHLLPRFVFDWLLARHFGTNRTVNTSEKTKKVD